MIRSLALVALLAAPTLAAGPAPVAADPGWLGAGVLERLAAIKAQTPKWEQVYLRVSNMSGFIDIHESRLGIDLHGQCGARFCDFSGSVGKDSIFLSASQSGDGYWLSGSGVSINLNRTASGWYAAGDAGDALFNASIDRFGGSYNLWGVDGAQVSASGFGNDLTVTGSVDAARFGRKQLAVLGAVLAVVNGR